MDALNKLGIDGGLLIAQIFNFALLMYILHRLFYKRILDVLDQRRDRIAQSMKDSGHVAAAAQEAEQEKA